MKRTILAVMLACGPLVGSGVAVACPDNWFTIEDVGMLSNLPAATVGAEDNGTPALVSWQSGQPCHGMCYDLPHGRLEVEGGSYLYGHSTNTVNVADEYFVEGPAGAPLSFEVVLVLDADITTEGYATAGIWVDGFGEKGLRLDATGQAITAIPVSFAPGAKFLVNSGVYAEGGHYHGVGHSAATIRFRGLPPEYMVKSCQGYALETPVHPQSWGGVKALYR